MKISCIVAEFNPLHMGHIRLIEQAKQHGDLTIVLMGGDFCQRGGSMVLDKYTRARHAIQSGADIVIELPTIYACASAQQFAWGAVRMASRLPYPTTLIFGSECGDMGAIQQAADILCTTPQDYQTMLEQLLRDNTPYPKAISGALAHYATRHKVAIPDMTLPNNILAVQYAVANNQSGNALSLATVARPNTYHGEGNAQAPSATQIRLAIQEGTLRRIADQIPQYVADDLVHICAEQDVLYMAALRNLTRTEAAELYDDAQGLGNRLWSKAQQLPTLSATLQATATKQYTDAHIRRLATYALLGIDKTVRDIMDKDYVYYNILGIRRDQLVALAQLAQGGEVYTCQADLLHSERPSCLLDAKAHDIYALLRSCTVDKRMVIIN